EKEPDLLDDADESFHVRFGRIALVRRRLDRRDRECDEQDGMSAKRLAVPAEHRAAVLLDLRGERVELTSVGVSRLSRRESNRSRRDFLPPDSLLLCHALSSAIVRSADLQVCR